MDLRGLFKNADNIKQFQAGTTIFTEGAPGDVMYVVLDGSVELQVGGHFLVVIGPGDVVGEMALIDSRSRSATAIAKTDCRLVPVDEKRFLFMVQQTPHFSLHVMGVLADRLRVMDATRHSQ